MKTFEIKNVDAKALDVDETSRRVKVALNKTGVKDHDKDIIEPTAFDKTIRERGPKAKNLIWHLTDHYTSLKHAVGKFKELFLENGYLVGITEIPKTMWGNDVLEFYKTEAINQHSIGYATVKREVFNDDDWPNRYQVLKEVTLYEGSAVLWGANEFTPTLSVGKSIADHVKCPKCGGMTKNMEAGMGWIKCSHCSEAFSSQIMDKETRKNEFKKTMDDLGSVYKLFKSGHLSDDTYELLEVKLLQLTNKLQQLFEETTQPAQEAVEPDSKGLLDVLTTFKQNIKTAGNGNSRTESGKAA